MRGYFIGLTRAFYRFIKVEKKFFLWVIIYGCLFSCSTNPNYPDPKTNPESPLMLAGDWFDHPHDIDFDQLPKIPSEHVVVSDVQPINGVNQLSISNDGMVFDKMGYLVGGRHIDYPHVLEHEGFLYIAFAGDKKQKIEVLKIRISDLNKLDMDGYKRLVK